MWRAQAVGAQHRAVCMVAAHAGCVWWTRADLVSRRPRLLPALSSTASLPCAGETEYRQLAPEELQLCQEACRAGGVRVRDCDPRLLQGLHRRGLVYFDIPIRPDDHVSIPPLEVRRQHWLGPTLVVKSDRLGAS